MMIGKAMAVHVVLTLAGCAIIGAVGSSLEVRSFGLAAMIGALQLTLMIWCWFQVVAKKSIALPGSVIVIKYAALGALIYKLIVDHWVDPLAFLVGLGVMVITVLIFGYDQIHDPAFEVF